MSERMTQIPFEILMTRVEQEYKANGTVFNVYRPYVNKADRLLNIFGEKLEVPMGMAAGPNTQLAQNIIAGYFAGARFFELKTVQVMDGEELAACISRPCILAEDEGYNCEWSTELYVPQAYEEYVKAWCAIKLISHIYGLGNPDGFIFNMSVGYDLAGIKSEKIDNFIEGLKDASDTPVFKECISVLKKLYPDESTYIDTISPHICSSVTLSTLHGCPPDEIERIAVYLLGEKHLNTFVKCNPTILGYESAREILDSMGYDYIAFDDHHFKEDLQYGDAIPMFRRLKALAEKNKLEFGLKLSNTFPVDVKAEELPSEEMYMSGKSLFPLTIEMANRISKEFDGKLRLSFSGGADYFNIDKLFNVGIWPITVATTILKPGGYQRLSQMADTLSKCEYKDFIAVNTAEVKALAEYARKDRHHLKAVKPLKDRKMESKVPLVNCAVAPCREGCPIHQDITVYMELVQEGKYAQALDVILDKNPLPFITGTICAHNCMSKCTRNFYEEPVHIRSVKLQAAQNGYDSVIHNLKPKDVSVKKIAIVGAGPAGLSAAYFLARGGAKVTIFEKENCAGGVVRNVIPGFRISDDAISKDIAIVEKLGVEIKYGHEICFAEELKSLGYAAVIFAVGAYERGKLDIQGKATINAIDFLKDFKKSDGELSIGKNVVVIGGGNTAMDTARAAKRTAGVENVYLVYRRTKRYMPADAEELLLALADGVEFIELASPKNYTDGMLICSKMALGDCDNSGRRASVDTGETIAVPADTIIVAVGEKVPVELYKKNRIDVDSRGLPIVDKSTNETSMRGIYVIGDGLNGPATVVEGIRDAQNAAEAILGKKIFKAISDIVGEETAISRKGILEEQRDDCDGKRCLNCSVICSNCVDVCPNRANISIDVPKLGKQILHVDYMCNECGNCKSFCPYSSAPYLDKLTLFANIKDFDDSSNSGFVVPDKDAHICRIRLYGEVFETNIYEKTDKLPEEIRIFIVSVIESYGYLFI